MRSIARFTVAAILTVPWVVVSPRAPSTAHALPPVSVQSVTVHEVDTEQPRIVSTRDLACTTATTCVIAADPTARTTDGGVTWQPVAVPPNGLPGLLTVDCPTALDCLGVDLGDESLNSSDGGATWHVVNTPVGAQRFSDVTCTSSTHCIGVGVDNAAGDHAAAWTTDNFGASWTPHMVSLSAGPSLDRIACASPSYCLTARNGDVLVSTDQGVTWGPPLGAPVPTVASGLACAPQSTTCIYPMVTNFAITTNAGATWKHMSLPVPALDPPPTRIDCPLPTRCVLVGGPTGGGFSLVIDPSTGFFVAGPGGVPQADSIDLLQCIATTTTCIAIAGPATALPYLRGRFAPLTLRSTDAGGTWSTVGAFVPSTTFRQLRCVDTTRCVAVGDVEHRQPIATLDPAVATSTDAGATWTRSSAPPTGVGSLSTLACTPGGTDCVTSGVFVEVPPAIPPTVSVVHSGDLGASWQPSVVDVALTDFRDPVCFAGGLCLASGVPAATTDTVVLRSTDRGATWTSVPMPKFFEILACQSASVCLAFHAKTPVGPGWMFGTADGGLNWHAVVPPTATSTPYSVPTCAPAGCAIPLYDSGSPTTSLAFTSDAGATWTRVPEMLLAGPSTILCPGQLCVRLTIVGPVTQVETSQYLGPWQVSGSGSTWRPALAACPQPTVCLALASSRTTLGSAIEKIDFVATPLPTVTGVVPARLLDTRSGPGIATVDHRFEGIGPVAKGAVLALTVAGRGGVPVGASAAVLNVTVTQPASAGFVTVYPCGQPRPVASNLNFTAGLTIANSFVGSIAANGTICIYSSATTQVVADVDAFVPAGSTSMIGVVPARLLETRVGRSFTTVDGLFQGLGITAGGSAVSLLVGGRGGVPSFTPTVVVNVTVTQPLGAGYVTVYACDQPRPVASNVNYRVGVTVANSVVAKLDPGGRLCIFTSATAHLIVDVEAYVAAATPYVDGLAPARLLETRTGQGLTTVDHRFEGGGPLAADSPLSVQIGGRGGVPVDASSAVLNVTITQPSRPGFVTVYPCDQPRPVASNVNFLAGATVANSVVTKLASDGTACIYSSAPTDVVTDVDAFMP